jgi:hypothetical protein
VCIVKGDDEDDEGVTLDDDEKDSPSTRNCGDMEDDLSIIVHGTSIAIMCRANHERNEE